MPAVSRESATDTSNLDAFGWRELVVVVQNGAWSKCFRSFFQSVLALDIFLPQWKVSTAVQGAHGNILHQNHRRAHGVGLACGTLRGMHARPIQASTWGTLTCIGGADGVREDPTMLLEESTPGFSRGLSCSCVMNWAEAFWRPLILPNCLRQM